MANKIKGLQVAKNISESDQALALARCLRDYIDRHGIKNQSFDVLKALATLTTERIEAGQGERRFTALNVLTAANISVPEGKAAGTRLSPIWNKLIEGTLAERQKGIQDFARNAGLQYYPWPEKDKTEGGRPSEYFLKGLPLPHDGGFSLHDLAEGEIAYIRELTPDPAWWAKPFLKNGYRLEGWRRGLFMAYGLILILLTGSVLIVPWILLGQIPVLPIKDLLTTLFVFATVGFLFWSALSPFVRLLDWRIVMAPTGLIALKETNVQMEIIKEADAVSGGSKIIRLVRYASTCPLCGAKIQLDEGRKEFPNRLIGRCMENPAEHVYSFDRFTCRGRKLR